MDRENMRIAFACIDKNTIWAIDEVVSGLYSVNKKDFTVKCIIDSKRLFQYESFRPYGLFNWKKDYLVIVPFELHKNWVIYNKITGKVKYKKVVEEKCKGAFAGIDEAENQAYFYPVTEEAPIIIVDLETLNCIRVIRVFDADVFEKNYTMAWKGICSEKYILFPIRGTKYVVRLDYGSSQVKFLESDIMEGINDIGFYSGELWALPMNGNKIYKIDENGKKTACVELLINRQNISVSEFSLIVVQKDYVFLLPYYQCGILVFDKVKKKMFIIAKESNVLPDTLKVKNMTYWGYYVDNNKLCFLPFKNRFLQIDLDHFSYEQKELYYPQEINPEFYYICNHVFEVNDNMIEADKYSQKSFFDYVQNNFFKEKIDTSSCGKKIWLNL